MADEFPEDWLELGLGSGKQLKGVCSSPVQGRNHDPSLGFFTRFGLHDDGYEQTRLEVNQGAGGGAGAVGSSCVTLNLFQTDHHHHASSTTHQQHNASGCVVTSYNHHGVRLHQNMDHLGEVWSSRNDDDKPVRDFYLRRPVPTGRCLGFTRITHRPRPETGVWFSLNATRNLMRDEVLPQIPKPYLRVKDENVTILMVKTYLVRKLGLSNESEIDISCKGQKLLHSQTLKHVRDAVWLPGVVNSINAIQSMETQRAASDHLMVLHYQRHPFHN